MHYILRQIVPDNSITPIEIHITKDEFKIGRTHNIRLSRFPQISRSHATFYKSDDGSLFIKDLCSLNGSFVNDNKIGTSLRSLSLGDIIGLGVTREEINTGFVCVLCSDDTPAEVKQEVIELSDDERQEEIINPKENLHIEDRISIPRSHVSDQIGHETNAAMISDAIADNVQTVSTTCQRTAENIVESIGLKTCVVRLERCDSEQFKLPLNVKNPCVKKKIKEIDKQSSNGKQHKHIRKSSSDFSSEDVRIEVLPSLSLSQNRTSFVNEDISDHQAGYNAKQTKCWKKRICSKYSTAKTSISSSENHKRDSFISSPTNLNQHASLDFRNKDYQSRDNQLDSTSNRKERNSSTDSCNSTENRKRRNLFINSQDSISSDERHKKNMFPSSTDCVFETTSSSSRMKAIKINDYVSDNVEIPAKIRKRSNSSIDLAHKIVNVNQDVSFRNKDSQNWVHDATEHAENRNKNFFSIASSDKMFDAQSPFSDSNLKGENIVNHEGQNNEVCYSQNDEVIIISDNEAYFDFKSSQMYVEIKEEPDETHDNDICMQIPQTCVEKCQIKDYEREKIARRNPSIDSRDFISSNEKCEKNIVSSSSDCIFEATSSNPSTDSRDFISSNEKCKKNIVSSSSDCMSSNLRTKECEIIGHVTGTTKISSKIQKRDDRSINEAHKIFNIDQGTSLRNKDYQNSNNQTHDVAEHAVNIKSHSIDFSDKTVSVQPAFPESELRGKTATDHDYQDTDELNYSQVEEVITILDDESYFDFKSSQTYVHIKEEPEELDDNGDDIYELIDDADSKLEFVPSSSIFAQPVTQTAESIECIQSFMGSTLQKDADELKSDSNKTNDLPLNDFFPQLSQNFEDDETSDSHGNNVSCTFDLSFNQSTVKNSLKINLCNEKNKSNEIRPSTVLSTDMKKPRRTLLIDPKPIPQKKHRMTGRMEGSVEKGKSVNPKPSTTKNKKKSCLLNKETLVEKKPINSCSKLSEYKIPRKSKIDNSVNESEKLEDAISKPLFVPYRSVFKKSPVKTRPDKLTSRMGFLVNEVNANPRKIKTSNKRETSKKASKSMKIASQSSTSKQGNTNDRNISVPLNKSVPPVSSNKSVTSDTPVPVMPSNKSITPNVPVPVMPSNKSTPNAHVPVMPSSKFIIPNTPVPVMPSNKYLTPNASVSIVPWNKSHIQSLSVPSKNFVTRNISIADGLSNSSVPNATMSVPINNVILPNACNRGTPVFNPRDPRQNRMNNSLPRLNSSVLPAHRSHVEMNNITSSNIAAGRSVLCERQNYMVPTTLSSKLIRNLTELNVSWLLEQNQMKMPPFPVRKGVVTLPNSFESYKAYVSSYCPMIMLEIWEQMFTEAKEFYASNKAFKKFYFSILSLSSKKDCIELMCESVVNEAVCFGPREGNIAILELKESSTELSRVFAYISNHKIQPLDLNYVSASDFKKLNKDWVTNAKHWIFSAVVKKRQKTYQLNTLMKANGLCYIKNKLRLADALECIKTSPLLTDILHPRWNSFLVNYAASPATSQYNSCQMEVIKGISNEIKKPPKEPKIILLQGPPGTGKTRTIIGLIENLLFSHNFNSSFKILVAAPSNAAVDEIGCRLIELEKRLSGRHNLKFVRVGIEEQIHMKLKPYFIGNKAREAFDHVSQGYLRQKERELQNLQAEINKLQREFLLKGRNEKLNYLKERYRLTNDSNFSIVYQDMEQKKNILKESHIILSTLSSCGLSLLLKTFKANSEYQFSCCIVDESTQCTELETLQPLVLGISKLVLVGDHKQLPATVISKMACHHGFERSAFERFYLYFDAAYNSIKTPMYTLSEQFRMHSAICEFPAKQFYDRKLITNRNTDLKYEEFPLHPYILLDILISQESNDLSSIVNCSEASVIVNICSYLQSVIHSPSTIAIITPYQAQRALYLSALSNNPWYKDIEVNTVDGFQGREKDIIILSCVRANSQSGSIGFLASKQRLNVAITRAKKCLIICAHTNSLMQNKDWEKLVSDAKERKLCIGVTSPKDIPMLFKEYMKKQ